MLNALALAYWQHCLFIFRLLRAIPVRHPVYFLIRLILFPLLWIASSVLLLINTLGFVADELLFSSYRKISIVKPLFVLGVPRSGTTWLQRVLANDKSLTTLTLSEAIFAPSISQRFLLKGFSSLIRPLSKLLAALPFNPLKKMDTIHKIRLDEPEEDFLLFIPLHACFLLALLCPKSQHYWKLARFDTALSSWQRKTVLRYTKTPVFPR